MIGDIEICITRRESFTVEKDRVGHWQRDDLRPGTVLEPQILNAIPVFVQRAIVRVLGIPLLNENQGLSIDETADVIDVAVRIIPSHAACKPEDVCRAEVIVERFFKAFSVETRIPDLDFRVQVALFSRQQCSAPVDFDSTPFEDEFTTADMRVEDALGEVFGRNFRHLAIFLPVSILGPGIEVEIDDGGLRPSVPVAPNKDGPAVPHPAAIGWVPDELDARRVGSCALEVALRGLLAGR